MSFDNEQAAREDGLPLYSPTRVRQLLEKYGLRATKSLGQNFLIDGNALRFMVEAAGVQPDSHVLEVGPGLGVLTHGLAETGATVTALEKDTRLEAVLSETLADVPNAKVIFADALEWEYSLLPQGSLLCANLPYYISTALISRFLASGRFAKLTFLVQREVAERLEAAPGQDGYGFLSAVVSLYGNAKRLRDVSKNSFFPVPDVTSNIAQIVVRPNAVPPKGMVQILEAALHHRRKTIRNNLRLAGYPDEAIEAALLNARLEPTMRGEDIALEQLALVAEVLHP
jgi:16S rRNA (adenine1518-N6/adenine1519-N6)-dimethyltransferase